MSTVNLDNLARDLHINPRQLERFRGMDKDPALQQEFRKFLDQRLGYNKGTLGSGTSDEVPVTAPTTTTTQGATRAHAECLRGRKRHPHSGHRDHRRRHHPHHARYFRERQRHRHQRLLPGGWQHALHGRRHSAAFVGYPGHAQHECRHRVLNLQWQRDIPWGRQPRPKRHRPRRARRSAASTSGQLGLAVRRVHVRQLRLAVRRVHVRQLGLAVRRVHLVQLRLAILRVPPRTVRARSRPATRRMAQAGRRPRPMDPRDIPTIPSATP